MIDHFDLGPSVLCPFVPGESTNDRHQRRVDLANTFSNEIVEWCKEKKVWFVPKRDGVWTFRFGDKSAVWRPRYGKLVVEMDKKLTVKAHDWYQAQYALTVLFFGSNEN